MTLTTRFFRLTQEPATKIRGVGVSYASALLAAHFPDLLPVLDRRVLNGAGIPVEVDSQGQVKRLADHYSALLNAFYEALAAHPDLTLRNIDRIWFCRLLERPQQRGPDDDRDNAATDPTI